MRSTMLSALAKLGVVGLSLCMPAKSQCSRKDCAPVCGPNPHACHCPAGTSYASATSYIFYPADAADVIAITAKAFSNLDWIGLPTINSTGNGFELGSTRTFQFPWVVVPKFVTITERLTAWNPYPDQQGFNMSWVLDNTPVDYTRKDGSHGQIAGFWSFEEVRQAGDLTFMLWTTWSCFGDSFDFTSFHEDALNSVSQILKKEGKLRGKAIGPVSF